ncbi:glycosyltransferase family 4 protein [Saccharicrinis sp. FJH54]|uniref:glycosyltransferase family 4 protein n=1 Tax=Saccharicrinis sp. FJH54 TaxID=3344665 RepID=UPI0035D48D9E
MKVLMFGWEFPPHISGGLGTASYGLTRGLSAQKDLDIIFVVPKAYGDEDTSRMSLIGANKIPITRTKVEIKENNTRIEYLEVSSRIVPYVDPDEYWKLLDYNVSTEYKTVQTKDDGTIEFSGKYGANLLEEIYNYSLVAEVIARDYDFDVIHAHDWLAYPAGMAAKRVSGKPLVIHVHATDFDRSRGNVNPEVYRMEKEGMDYADKIISVSNLTRNTVIEKYFVDPAKVTTVYNAVEPISNIDKLKIKKGIDDKVVTFLGRITMQKGPEYFVEAAYRVLQKMNNVRFVMAGSGDMMRKMISMAATRKIADRFHFTGFLKGDQVFEMLKVSDVYIMPSVSEPFGISPLEAMQSNVPVIISKQSGVAEILTHAFKVDYWDIDATADMIYGLLKYPALSSMFKKMGRIEVDNLKWENAALKVREVYNSVYSPK